MYQGLLHQPSATTSSHWLLAATIILLLFFATQAQAVQPALGHDDVAWLQHATFGLDSKSVARYQRLGRKAYLEEELVGRNDSLPPAVDALIRSYEAIDTAPEQLLEEDKEQREQLRSIADSDAKMTTSMAINQHRRRLYTQAAQAELLHAIYGGDQLKEQVVWFWLNHFSVYAGKTHVPFFVANYTEDTIRPHAMGRFRDLVMATLRSPAMLEFLDNAKNVKGRTNENYARELMELHTLGVGSGYTQQDVQQLALILTGAGINVDGNIPQKKGPERGGMVQAGLFVFDPRKHDFSDKTFLGHVIKGSGYGEIEQAVELITRQPACARFISRKLAEYFVADQPPPALVDAMAKTFRRTDGDIASVLRTMFDSPQIEDSYGKKFKDPIQFLVSAMRLAYDGKRITNARVLTDWATQMGEPMFGRVTPDGWPLAGSNWAGSGQMAKRFDIAHAIGSGWNRLFMDEDDTSKPGANPPLLDTPLYRQTIEPYLSSAARTALDQAKSVSEWNTYLLSSPDFNYR